MGDKPSSDDGKADKDVIVPKDEATIAFVRGLVQRGEAVRLAPGAPLPPRVTHEIVGETDAGEPVVKRRRFSAY
jgi:hypothetical protein